MRIRSVKKSRKAWRCSKCGGALPIGSGYIWWKYMRGPTIRWGLEHGHPRPSDLTTSDKLANLYLAQETIEDITFAPSEIEEISEDLGGIASEVEEAGALVDEAIAGYQESVEQITQYFPNGNPTSEECEEKIGEAETWRETFNEAAYGLDDLSATFQADPDRTLEDYTTDYSAQVEDLLDPIKSESPYFL